MRDLGKEYPMDIFAVSDIEKWSKDFWWPVSQEHYNKIGENLFFKIRDYLSNENDLILNHLLNINISHFFPLFCNLMHSVVVLQEFKKKDINVVYSKNSKYLGNNVFIERYHYKDIVEKGAPIAFVNAKWGFKSKTLKEKLRYIYFFIGKIKWDLRKLDYDNGLPVVVFNSSDTLKCHLNYTKKKVFITHAEQWLSGYKKTTLDSEIIGQFKEVGSVFRKMMSSTASEFDIKWTKELDNYIEKYIYINLEYSASLFFHLINHRWLERPIHLWGGAAGNFNAQVLSEAVKYKGGKVSLFSEPGGITGIIKPNYTLTLFANCDRFGVYSPKEIELLEKLMEIYPPVQKKAPELFSFFYDGYKNIFIKHQKEKLPNKIKKVMFVPTSYMGDFLPLYHPPDMVHLDWEYRLINLLINSGYDVIYKKHPKGLLTSRLFRPFGNRVEYIEKPFQEIMNIGDAFIFDTIPSTAMYEAMCTKKPVIFIYHGGPKILTEPMRLLSKRCRIVSAKFDKHNRVIVNKDELLCALKKPPGEPNFKYLEKYMFPLE